MPLRRIQSRTRTGQSFSLFRAGFVAAGRGRVVWQSDRNALHVTDLNTGTDASVPLPRNWVPPPETYPPPSASFDPSGQFLYCCNQRADNVAVFRVNRKTGGLDFTGHFAAVGNPSHVVFLDLAKGT